MALANNEENYMAPASVRRMAEDLALLPVWYAQPGSMVLAPSAYHVDFLKEMQRLFSLPVQLVTEPELAECPEADIMPWGWNPAIRKRMLKAGVRESLLPQPDALHKHRLYSSRSYLLPLYAYFMTGNKRLEYTCGCARIVTDKEFDRSLYWLHCLSASSESVFSKEIVFKKLWSSSGKGLYWCHGKPANQVYDWCRHTLSEDKSFMMEPVYDKAEDFAMEFYSDGEGGVSFLGYSRFTTNEKGAYCGNRLTSDHQVEKWIQQYVPLEAFLSIRERLSEGLKMLYGKFYKGYLGVDMMVCRQHKGHPYAIHPCVEVNLRMNMGILSHNLCDRFVATGCEGRFMIDHFASNKALREKHEQDSIAFPLVVKEGKIVSGYLSLVPVTPESRYRAYVCVEGAF